MHEEALASAIGEIDDRYSSLQYIDLQRLTKAHKRLGFYRSLLNMRSCVHHSGQCSIELYSDAPLTSLAN